MDFLLTVGLGNAAVATALALLALVVDRTLRRPVLSHVCWLLVLVKLVTPPLVTLPWFWPGTAPTPVSDAERITVAPVSTEPEPPPERATATEPAERLEARPVVFESPPAEVPWQALALGAWLGGSLVWWAIAAVRVARFGRVLRLTREAPPEVRRRVRELAGSLGLRQCPTVVMVPGAVSPLLWAPGRAARLLLPEELWGRLDEDQRDSLLVHELAHLRRRDHWVRRLELLILGLYWWFPVAWWARRELQDAEECCCDGWVEKVLPGCGPAYAAALVETVAFLSAARAAVPLGASGGGRSRQLKRRLTMILECKAARPAGKVAAAVVLCLGLVLLALAPGAAESPPAKEVVVTEPQETRQTFPATDPVTDDQMRLRLLTEQWRAAQKQQAALEEQIRQLRMARENPRREQVEAAREEVELLQAQLAVRRAQHEAAKQALDSARPTLQRTESRFKAGRATIDELEKAQSDLKAREMDVQVRAAEILEPEVRLKQARRRLATLEGESARERNPAKPAGNRQLDDIEKKLDELRREIESLRKESPPGDAALPASSGNTGVAYVRQRAFQIPFSLSVAQRQHTKDVLLFVSQDEGKSWDVVGRTEPAKRKFSYEAPGDGRYLFQVGTEDEAGNRTPAAPRLPASKVVVVDTTKPRIAINLSHVGKATRIQWVIREVNPDPSTFRLECCVADEWKLLSVESSLIGRTVVNEPVSAVRLRLKDLAGNEQTEKVEAEQ
jgi:beta-lactamase regulating signal transducer with metallopeptidase domain